MTYQETLEWLFSQLPMYQRQGASAYKADLSNTLALVDYLKHPEYGFKSIHIAGTNGKGSTSHMLASVLQEQGYKVGLYTSPHLKDFRERIRINGTMIPKSQVVEFIETNKAFFELNRLSFFEMTVGLAFQHFAENKVDIAVIEVGLGGRLDSTNIITPEVSVITNIGYDHQKFLGDTLAEIAFEKAGIIKDGIPVVIGRMQKETIPVFEKKAKDHKATLFFAEIMIDETFDSDLKGSYQQENQRTVLTTIEVLRQIGWNISKYSILKGLLNVVNNTGLQGRWQILNQTPLIICDTAHNEDGLKIVLTQLSKLDYQKLHIVLGFVNDKDVSKILLLFPRDAIYYFAAPAVPRGMDVAMLAEKAKQQGLKGKEYSSVEAAYQSALKSANQDDIVYIGGSTFTVAEIL